MSTSSPDILADPLGVVVALVTAIEPVLDRAVVEAAVAAVAAGRAKRRRLAQTLSDQPELLVGGRSQRPAWSGTC